MQKIEELKKKSLKELLKLYEELFGQPSSSKHLIYLARQIAYKLQENEVGGFPKSLTQKITALIKEHDPINMAKLRSSSAISKKHQVYNQRLPIPGTVITREYRDQLIEVKVLEKGFDYKGKQYRSLTAIAEEITNSHWSGYEFFNL